MTLTPSVANFEPSIGWMPLQRMARPAGLRVRRRQAADDLHVSPNTEPGKPAVVVELADRTGHATDGTKGHAIETVFRAVVSRRQPVRSARSQKDYWSVGIGFVFGL